jgi:hypothetical protein
MLDRQCVTRIWYAARRRIKQTELSIGRAQQHHATIAGHAASVKADLYNTPIHSAKFSLTRSYFFGLVWQWQSCVVIGVRYQ